jgi:hypothetical protein
VLDTLKLSLTEFDIDLRAALDVQPASFNAATGEARGDCPLWRAEGQTVIGSKAFYNGDDFNVTVQPRTASEPTSIGCYVQFSVPKVADGSNYEPADLNATKTALQTIERELKEIGVHTNINTATLSRLDSCKTIQFAEGFSAYEPVLRALRGARVSRRDYGTTFLWHNTLQEICVYDKIEEMKRHKRKITGLNPNSIRFEHRLLKARKVRDAIGLSSVNDLLSGFEQVGCGYRAAMEKQLFRLAPSELTRLSAAEIVTHFEHLKARGSRYFLRDYLVAVGMNQMVDDVAALESALATVSDSRMTLYRLRKQLDAARIVAMSLRESSQSKRTLGELYREMEREVLAV